MAASDRSKRSRERARARRERLRQQGLRRIEIWVPDVRSPEFARAAREQSLAVANSPYEKEDQDFVDAASDWDDA
jgi:Antitoxin MazE-like